jgi:hypothetical protein
MEFGGEEKRLHEKVAQYALIELIQDPLIGMVMKSNGVHRRSIERVVRERMRPSWETAPCTRC